jgi:cytosine/adenosine deaminase-related metal-dependent hydrolase
MDPERRILRGGALLVSGSMIEQVFTRQELETANLPERETIEAGTLTAIPGFVQSHIHLCQTLFRGLAENLDLLEWLRRYIFPLEAAHTAASIEASARVGLAELIRSGTTTIMDMGSIHHQDALASTVEDSGIRAVLGKSMIDRNDLYPPFCEHTDDALRSTQDLARRWHKAADGRIRYAVAPRFVLSCSDELLLGAHAIASEQPGVLFHTHASESERELEAVIARCGMRNIEYFAHRGILDHRSRLAHCVWISHFERELLAECGARVLHCPSANLKLGSGIADIPAFLERGIGVSLGADGAPCNNTLDIFHEMRLGAQLQKLRHGAESMDARTVFELATLGGAAAVGLSDEIGSLESGKQADLVLVDLERLWNPLHQRDPYAAIVHSASPENVHSVMVAGRWLYRDGSPLGADGEELLETARNELEQLIKRARLS